MKAFRIYRHAILVVIGILYFFVCLHRLSPTVIARDLALSLQADAFLLGIISSAYFYLYSGLQPVVGYLSDTAGPRKVMASFFFVSAVGSVVFGLAPNAAVAVMGRVLIGAGLAGVFIPALKVFSRWYRPNQFASLTGVMVMIGGVGGLAAAMPFTYLVVLLGWRGSFVAIGVLSAALAVLAWIIVRDSPKDRGWLVQTAEDGTAPAAGEEIPFSRRFGAVFENRNFWLVCLSVFLSGGANLSFQGLWAVPYLMDVFGLDRVQAGWMLMAWPLGFAIGGPASGFLADRFNLNRKKALLWGLGLSGLAWLLLIFIRDREHLVIVVPLFFLFGAISGGMLPLSYSIIRDLFPFSLMGTATGLMNTASFFGTAVYQPFTGFLLRITASAHPGSYDFAAYRTLIIVFFLSYAASFIAMSRLSTRKTGE